MNLTPNHATYFAHELTTRCSSQTAEQLTRDVASAQAGSAEMTPRPHQSSGDGHGRDAGGPPPPKNPSPRITNWRVLRSPTQRYVC